MLKKKINHALSVLGLLCLFSAPAAAAPPIDMVSWVGTQLNTLVDGHIDLFVTEGQTLLVGIMAVLLVYYLIVGLLSRELRNELIIELIFNFMLCQMMLTFYDTPLPWGGVSFHSLFASEAQWAAATIDVSTINDVISGVLAMWKGAVAPPLWDVTGGLIYVAVMLQLGLVWLFCSGVTLIAHIALGFGALVGPLLIWTFVWPIMNFLFWGWVRFMITYALYIISSSAVVYVYAHVILGFFTTYIAGDFSAAKFAAIILPFIVLNGIFVLAFWQCHSWARDLASGSASAGEHVSGAVQAAAVAFLG